MRWLGFSTRDADDGMMTDETITDKAEREKYWRQQDETNATNMIREEAVKLVVGLYKANAMKASETTFASDKLVGDLVTDARHVERYIKGEI